MAGKSVFSFSFSRREMAAFIVLLISSSALLRLCVGVGYYTEFDTFWYRNWAVALSDGFFDIYSRADQISLDYPPLYLVCLYFTGLAYKLLGIGCDGYTQMFLMKFWPIFFDCLLIWVLWRIGVKVDAKAGIVAALLWAFNPSMFFNSAIWGQTDQLMCLMLVIAFFLAYQDRPILACFVFALAGMTKFQCLYFTPVLLLFVFYKSGIKHLLKGIRVAAVTVIAVFLPFMIGASDPFLFFNVYLSGANTYPHCTLNAYNIYGIMGLNWVEETKAIIGGFTYAHLSNILLIVSLVFCVGIYITGVQKCGFVGAIMLMQCVFMLTVRMHERYQVAVLPFALMAWVIHREKPFLQLFSALSFVTLLNQALVLFRLNGDCSWDSFYITLMQVLSAVNFIIFIWSIFICVKFFVTPKSKEVTNCAIQ